MVTKWEERDNIVEELLSLRDCVISTNVVNKELKIELAFEGAPKETLDKFMVLFRRIVELDCGAWIDFTFPEAGSCNSVEMSMRCVRIGGY